MATIRLSDDDIAQLAVSLASTPVVLGGPVEKVKLGKNLSLVNAILNVSSGTITIGDDTFFGHNVCILAAKHPTKGNRQDWVKSGCDIVIGRNVWIASNVTVLGPCKIGDHAVVAAGAVVTKDVEEGWIYAGIPARKLKRA